MSVGGVRSRRRGDTTQSDVGGAARRLLASLTQDFKALESSYGDDVLHLVIASGYLAWLINNPEIERYLRARHPEIGDEFRAIISAASLDQTSPAPLDREPFGPLSAGAS